MSDKVFVDINDDRVELVGEELDNWKKQAAAEELYMQNKAKLEAAAYSARETAQAKLAALGLTTDDLKALGL